MAAGTIASQPMDPPILNFDVCVNVKKCASGAFTLLILSKSTKKRLFLCQENVKRRKSCPGFSCRTVRDSGKNRRPVLHCGLFNASRGASAHRAVCPDERCRKELESRCGDPGARGKTIAGGDQEIAASLGFKCWCEWPMARRYSDSSSISRTTEMVRSSSEMAVLMLSRCSSSTRICASPLLRATLS